jgi:methylglyoxal reductase
MQASVVALGTWVMGGWTWGGADQADSLDAIRASIDAGVNFIDTAPIYGFGLSEETVGIAVEGRRDKVLLATKCGMVCNTMEGEHKFNSNALGPDPEGHINVRINLRPDSIRREVEASLRRLRTDCIDLLQTHWQDSTTPISDTMGAMLRLQEEGKIRGIGVCNATARQIDDYRRLGPVVSDQELYSMIDRAIESDQLPYCRQQEISVLAYSPLARGLLTGKMGPERHFNAGDLRLIEPRYSVENRRRIALMLERFRPIADEHGLTLAQLVIAWTAHQPGLTHVLCGARNRQQALENAAAGEVELRENEIQTIDEAIDEFLAVAV